jgi:hypothetical protein
LPARLRRCLISATDGVLTLAERTPGPIRRKREALDALRPALAAYARDDGGRFLLFGSAARDARRRDSNIDILTDFPEEPTGWRSCSRSRC